MKDLRVSASRLLSLSVCVLALTGCGGGASTSPAPVAPTPVSSTATLRGQWQIVAHSNVNPASSLLVEANFTQSGSTVTADTSSVVLIDGAPSAFTGLAGECDAGVLGDDSVQASVSGQTVSVTLTEAGSLGTVTATGNAIISGTQLSGGTYQTPAACGFAADNGSFTGTTIAPFSGTFAGQLLNFTGSTDSVSVTLSQSGYTLNAVGTNAGAPITLTGKVIGATFNVTGMVQGQSREYVGVYDTTANAFLVYNNQFQSLGSLTEQTSGPPPPPPISVTVSPSTASVAPSGTQTFTATVSNDPAGKGVTWSLSCATANGCGSVSGISSGASGGGVIYTAPAAVPSSIVTITATSVDDASKSASATIMITANPPIAVTVSPTSASLPTGGATQTFTATVQNDSENKGVTWALSGANCNGAGCGSVSPASSASGAPVTYTSPANATGPVTLTATSVSNNAVSASATITLTAIPVNLGAGSFPSAGVDSNGVIDIAWFTESGIAFARSQDKGVTFSSPAVVVPAPAFEPSISVDEQGDVFILTGGNPTNSLGGDNVVVAHSTDGGKTFTAVTAEQNTYESLLLVQPSGVVDLAYTTSDDNEEDPDNALHETRSTDGGNTFTNDQTLWTAPINGSDIRQWQGALGLEGQIYYTWTEQVDINCEIHFVNSLDGVTFQPSIMLTNDDVCNRDGALVVDSAGNIDATWSGDTDFARSTNQGQTFTTPTLVPIGQLAVSPNGALNSVVDGQPLTFTRSLDNGVTWSAPVTLGLSGGDSQIAVDPNGKITVVWRDDSNGAAAGDFDVYISTSTDGKNFTPATNISNATGAFASAPTVLISPQGLRYIYWYETSISNAADVNVFFYAGQ